MVNRAIPIGINMECSAQSFVPGFSSHNADVNKIEKNSQNTLKMLYAIPMRTFFIV